MTAAGPTRGSSGRARFGESKRHFVGAAEPPAVSLTVESASRLEVGVACERGILWQSCSP
jgi:hypothetical protein